MRPPGGPPRQGIGLARLAAHLAREIESTQHSSGKRVLSLTEPPVVSTWAHITSAIERGGIL